MLNSLQRDQSKEIGQGVQCRQCVHLSRFISSFRSMSLHLIQARCLWFHLWLAWLGTAVLYGGHCTAGGANMSWAKRSSNFLGWLTVKNVSSSLNHIESIQSDWHDTESLKAWKLRFLRSAGMFPTPGPGIHGGPPRTNCWNYRQHWFTNSKRGRRTCTLEIVDLIQFWIILLNQFQIFEASTGRINKLREWLEI